MRKKILEWAERHAVALSGLSLVLVITLQLWSMFSDEPLVPVAVRWFGALGIEMSVVLWIIQLLAVLVLVVVVYARVMARRRIRVVKEVASTQEKGLLDFGAGIEQALIEYTMVLTLLNGDVRRLGRIAEANVRRLESAKSLSVKRHLTERVAKKMDRVSETMEPRIVRLETSTNLLQESFVGFVEVCEEEEVLKTLGDTVPLLMENIPAAIGGMTGFRKSIRVIQKNRINQQLTDVLARLEGRVDRILGSLQTIVQTCEKVISVIDWKTGATDVIPS